MKKLIVLGPGCARCDTLAQLTAQAAEKAHRHQAVRQLRSADDPGVGGRR
jgi:hypothetical protein